jgi:tRNA nucleotidyltransferase (CCA-adding enzyme)
MMVIDTAARLGASLAVRFACLMHDLGKGTTPADALPRHPDHELRSVALLQQVCERWRIPVDVRELAEVVAREHGHVHASGALDATGLVRLLERCDAFRKPARFAEALLACECDSRGRLGYEDAPYPQRARLLQVLATAAGVATDAVARAAQQAGATGPKIGEAIHRARVDAVAASLPAGD